MTHRRSELTTGQVAVVGKTTPGENVSGTLEMQLSRNHRVESGEMLRVVFGSNALPLTQVSCSLLHHFSSSTLEPYLKEIRSPPYKHGNGISDLFNTLFFIKVT